MHADTENDDPLKAKYGLLLFHNIFTQLFNKLGRKHREIKKIPIPGKNWGSKPGSKMILMQ